MHKTVELLLGRLATDPRFRLRFRRDPAGLLHDLAAQGLELTTVEIDALASLDPEAIDAFAGTLDRRLRRATTPNHGEENQ
jgi:hypothetical protein